MLKHHSIKLLLLFSLLVFAGCKDKEEPAEAPEPDAYFEYNHTGEGMIEFINLSENATSYAWDFGDTQTSSIKNPAHQYTLNGSFTVVLVATNGDKTDQYSSTVVISDFTTDSWEQVENFPGGKRAKAYSFRIGETYYVGYGTEYVDSWTDMWSFDPVAGTWTQKNNGPAIINGGVCFVIGNLAYIGLGESNVSPNVRFWKYDPAADTWAQIANFPGYGNSTITGATAFSYNGFGYVLNGNNTFTIEKEFWKYNPATNSWQQLDDFPGEARHLSSHFLIDDRVYVGCGAKRLGGGNSIFYDDLWEYNFTTAAWTKKADFPGEGRLGAAGFTINGKGYIGLGWRSVTDFYNFETVLYSDVWSYNPATNTWKERTSFPDLSRVYAFVMEFDGYVWIGTGKGQNGSEQNDMWEYKLE
jgi:N-acetylneuraminic acid mutarotase